MPIAWGNHDRRQIFLNVAILDSAAATLVQQGQQLPNVQMCKALVDTGATSTCITPQAAAKLGLSPIGKTLIQGVGGAKYHNNYLFYLGFTTITVQTGPSAGVATQVAELHMLPTPIQGAEIDAANAFEVLLGMDVICTGSLKIEGNGTFSWAW